MQIERATAEEAFHLLFLHKISTIYLDVNEHYPCADAIRKNIILTSSKVRSNAGNFHFFINAAGKKPKRKIVFDANITVRSHGPHFRAEMIGQSTHDDIYMYRINHGEVVDCSDEDNDCSDATYGVVTDYSTNISSLPIKKRRY